MESEPLVPEASIPLPKETEVGKNIPVAKTIAVKESTRPKTTLNLGNILKPTTKTEEVKAEKHEASQKQNEPITEYSVMQAWRAFAESKKDQSAEYHLLNQPFTLKGNTITLFLTNPIEEPLLQGMKSDLVAYLREQVNNNTLMVEGEIQQNNTKRKAYTNKEKFQYMVEKNPLLKELQEKLGLDPDY